MKDGILEVCMRNDMKFPNEYCFSIEPTWSTDIRLISFLGDANSDRKARH